MIRISESERKAILKRYPDAWIKATKNHAYLAGYETSFAFQFLRELRNGKPRQKPKPARKDSRKPNKENYNRQPRKW